VRPPYAVAVAACQSAACADAGRFADGGIRMPTRPASVVDAGARDAALSTNMIGQADAATPRVAGAPTCDGGACSGYRVRGGFVSGNSATSGALRVSEQRIEGMPVSCGDVHGTQLCVRGGVR
jgi:hypothetical protein